MSYTINVEIKATLRDGWLLTRILHFKEDLHREFLRDGQATITDPAAVDRALTPLSIIVPSKRFLGQVTAFITKAAQQREVADAVLVSRAS